MKKVSNKVMRHAKEERKETIALRSERISYTPSFEEGCCGETLKSAAVFIVNSV